MYRELPYFKFNPAKWLLGRISCEKEQIQGAFVKVCCIYWHEKCSITINNLYQKYHKSKVKALVDRNYITVEDDIVCIEFLDEQFEELTDLSDKRSSAGRKGGQAKVKQSLSKAKASLKHLDKDKDKDKDKIKSKTFNPPQLQEVIEYFNSNNYTTTSANKFYNYYKEGDWKDSNDKKVVGWKQKAQGVWFKPENEIPKSKIPSLN